MPGSRAALGLWERAGGLDGDEAGVVETAGGVSPRGGTVDTAQEVTEWARRIQASIESMNRLVDGFQLAGGGSSSSSRSEAAGTVTSPDSSMSGVPRRDDGDALSSGGAADSASHATGSRSSGSRGGERAVVGAAAAAAAAGAPTSSSSLSAYGLEGFASAQLGFRRVDGRPGPAEHRAADRSQEEKRKGEDASSGGWEEAKGEGAVRWEAGDGIVGASGGGGGGIKSFVRSSLSSSSASSVMGRADAVLAEAARGIGLGSAASVGGGSYRSSSLSSSTGSHSLGPDLEAEIASLEALAESLQQRKMRFEPKQQQQQQHRPATFDRERGHRRRPRVHAASTGSEEKGLDGGEDGSDGDGGDDGDGAAAVLADGVVPGTDPRRRDDAVDTAARPAAASPSSSEAASLFDGSSSPSPPPASDLSLDPDILVEPHQQAVDSGGGGGYYDESGGGAATPLEAPGWGSLADYIEGTSTNSAGSAAVAWRDLSTEEQDLILENAGSGGRGPAGGGGGAEGVVEGEGYGYAGTGAGSDGRAASSDYGNSGGGGGGGGGGGVAEMKTARAEHDEVLFAGGRGPGGGGVLPSTAGDEKEQFVAGAAPGAAGRSAGGDDDDDDGGESAAPNDNISGGGGAALGIGDGDLSWATQADDGGDYRSGGGGEAGRVLDAGSNAWAIARRAHDERDLFGGGMEEGRNGGGGDVDDGRGDESWSRSLSEEESELEPLPATAGDAAGPRYGHEGGGIRREEDTTLTEDSLKFSEPSLDSLAMAREGPPGREPGAHAAARPTGASAWEVGSAVVRDQTQERPAPDHRGGAAGGTRGRSEEGGAGGGRRLEAEEAGELAAFFRSRASGFISRSRAREEAVRQRRESRRKSREDDEAIAAAAAEQRRDQPHQTGVGPGARMRGGVDVAGPPSGLLGESGGGGGGRRRVSIQEARKRTARLYNSLPEVREAREKKEKSEERVRRLLQARALEKSRHRSRRGGGRGGGGGGGGRSSGRK
ncbi:hypothetical protein Esi_0146_0024 [Ectocarpus siliculosus]|uniref:ALMS motif domain-containing protein n=1 Tax=Ectocarpus siliculosus TaxID=2880 RepID=D7FKL2_ECTSI|nr:hypothetical protein Esi_0146_0024 [Ectocarpus siliculosus]|eukprot:CBJ29412.1 hypothetical protein Esi_0146_0024 [Ectocarpus siliculosus]